ncbi:MATE family efflux transporter [Anabaena sp. CCY 0017]|uniref:MATE family efflux transporter n=1 Tax=Anabaena sp. CCY 0017 TaxID=3103866 RepID=UPI0039C64A69
MLTKSHIRTEINQFIKLAIPLAGAQVAQAAVGFVDTIMMGQLGPESLASGGLASISFQFVLNTSSGVVMAVSPLVAEAQGAGQKTQIEQIVRQGLWLSIILSIPMMLVVGHLNSFMLYLGQAATTVKLADSYLNFVLWGILPGLGFAMLRGYVSALSQASVVLPLVILGTLVNVAGNYILGYGNFGFPRMELAGLGLASAIGLWTMFLGLLIYTRLHPKLKKYPFWQDLHQLKPKILQQLAGIGVAIAVTIAVEYGLFTAVTFFMGTLGVEVLAAHQTVYQTMMLIFMVPLGMSYAVTVRVGFWLGQQNIAGARRAGYVGVTVAGAFMILTAIVLLTYPQQIIGIYLDIHDPANAELFQLAMPMLFISALSQFLDGVQRVAMGALYGLQDTQVPMLLSIFSFWGIGLTSGYVLGFPLGFGGVGLWAGQSIGVAIAGVIFLWRFHRLTFKRKPLL